MAKSGDFLESSTLLAKKAVAKLFRNPRKNGHRGVLARLVPSMAQISFRKTSSTTGDCTVNFRNTSRYTSGISEQ